MTEPDGVTPGDDPVDDAVDEITETGPIEAAAPADGDDGTAAEQEQN